MFKAIGILVAIYTLYAAMLGEVFVKSGIRGKTISKGDSPPRFWTVIGIYALLSGALLTVF